MGVVQKGVVHKVCVLNGVVQIESCVNVVALFVLVVSGL